MEEEWNNHQTGIQSTHFVTGYVYFPEAEFFCINFIHKRKAIFEDCRWVV
jgi:hypothetical protein